MGSSRDARHDDASHPFLVIVPTQIAGEWKDKHGNYNHF